MATQTASPQKNIATQKATVAAGVAGKNGVSTPAVPASFAMAAVQLKNVEEEPLQKKPFQLKSAPVQMATADEEAEPVQMKAPFQLKGIEEEMRLQKKPFQLKSAPIQKATADEEEEPMQMKPFQLATDKPAAETDTRPNQTGMPDNLKAGVEALSGIAMDEMM